MTEWIDTLNDLGVLPYLIAPSLISIIGIMPVYISGVLMGWVSWWKAKSAIAVLSMFYASIHWFMAFGLSGTYWQDSWTIISKFSIAVCIYTWILARMRNRMDKVLDRRIAEDDEDYKKTDRRRRKK